MITKEWLVGFIEGEGNFNVSLSRSFSSKGKYLFEYYPILQFRIFLREDDLNALEQIKEFTKIGNIYKKSYKYSRDKGVNSQDQVNYVISSIKELLILKDLLISTEFHTKKKQDMKNFFEILDLKKEKKHLTLEGYNHIIFLANSMNSKNRINYLVKPLTE